MIYYEYYHFGEAGDYVVKEYDEFHYPYLHFHRNYELVQLFDGKVAVSVDGAEHILEGGEFILLFPNQTHSFTALEKSKARVCIFSPELINEFYQANRNLCPEKTVTRLSESVRVFLAEQLTKSAERYVAKACLYAVCAEITKQTKLVPQITPKNFQLIHRLITYISKNFKTEITLQSAAKELGYSYQYLSNSLSRYRIRFIELVHQYRLDYAKHLLKTTTLPITEIAFDCGYNSVRTFNRNFQTAFHCTPQQYKNAK